MEFFGKTKKLLKPSTNLANFALLTEVDDSFRDFNADLRNVGTLYIN